MFRIKIYQKISTNPAQESWSQVGKKSYLYETLASFNKGIAYHTATAMRLAAIYSSGVPTRRVVSEELQNNVWVILNDYQV